MEARDPDGPLHVLDLPQIYTKPSGIELMRALNLLAIKPRSFSTNADEATRTPTVQPAGVTRYLTSIISSPLSWLENDALRDTIYDAASARLSERSGRTAMPAMSRGFAIPTRGKELTLTLHEPSLTSDNLGMKTWVSSYLLSRRLLTVLDTAPGVAPLASTASNTDKLRALELGAGTGLVGLSFAALCGQSAIIHLTDLPEIVPNLEHNVALNVGLLNRTGATVTTGILDWSIVPNPLPTPEEQYDIILAADSLYSPVHPELLTNAITQWLSRGPNARVVCEMPLRDAYISQVEDFKKRMNRLGLSILGEGEESGYDDWETPDGSAVEVRCWWSVWGWI